jgi:hypothetical protein
MKHRLIATQSVGNLHKLMPSRSSNLRWMSSTSLLAFISALSWSVLSGDMDSLVRKLVTVLRTPSTLEIHSCRPAPGLLLWKCVREKQAKAHISIAVMPQTRKHGTLHQSPQPMAFAKNARLSGKGSLQALSRATADGSCFCVSINGFISNLVVLMFFFAMALAQQKSKRSYLYGHSADVCSTHYMEMKCNT